MAGWTAQQSQVDKVVLNLGVEGSNPLGQQGRAPPSSVVSGTRCQDERLRGVQRGRTRTAGLGARGSLNWERRPRRGEQHLKKQQGPRRRVCVSGLCSGKLLRLSVEEECRAESGVLSPREIYENYPFRG